MQSKPSQAAGANQQKLRHVGQCLYRSARSKMYYAIAYIGKRQVKRSLKTRDAATAKRKVAEFRAKVGNLKAHEMSRWNFKRLATCWLEDHKQRLSKSTIRGKTDTIELLFGILGDKPVRNITEGDIGRWKDARAPILAGRSFNWELEIMRGVFQYAINKGLMMADPSRFTARAIVRYRPVTIPSKEEYKALIAQLRASYKNAGAADFVELLAFSGCAQLEAGMLTWADVDFKKNRLSIGIQIPDGDPQTQDGIKTPSRRRSLPMNPSLRALLEKLRKQSPNAKPTETVVTIKSARKGLQTACGKLWGQEKKDRFTHHDFRHFFVTNCIEAGVDVRTISRWVGHRDGGALLMRTYGHLREQHSDSEAAKVKFD